MIAFYSVFIMWWILLILGVIGSITVCNDEKVSEGVKNSCNTVLLTSIFVLTVMGIIAAFIN
jgi:predicted secreted protein